MSTPRRPLGRWSNAGSRGHVYLTDEAIEIDEHDGWQIARRRIFLDDIVMITLHRSRSWLGFWIMACLASLPLILGAAFWRSGPSEVLPAVIGMAAFSVPFFACAVLFLRRFAVVSIVGRRTRTRMTWWLARSGASRVYDELCQLAASRSAEAPAAEALPLNA